MRINPFRIANILDFIGNETWFSSSFFKKNSGRRATRQPIETSRKFTASDRIEVTVLPEAIATPNNTDFERSAAISAVTEVNSPIISSESASSIVESETPIEESSPIVGEREVSVIPMTIDSPQTLAVSLPIAPATASAASETFFVIGLPDTQKYADNYPDTFKAQTQWVVDNQQAYNIKFVSHYGDIVEHGTNSDAPGEYQIAVEAMDMLRDANIAHGIAPGNHDVLPAGVHLPGIWDYDNSNYLQSFNPDTWHAGQEVGNGGYYGGASPSGLSNYQFFEGGDTTFLALHLDLETPHGELAWAQEVIDANRDKPVMVTTHRYLQDAEDYSIDNILYLQTRPYDSGRVPNIWYSATGEILYNPDGMYAEDFFQHFVAGNSNIFLVNAGHDAQEYRQTSTNIKGLPVHEVLADFTYLDNGGDGYLRMMEFDVAGDRINVSSYSPTLNQFKTDGESQFSLDVDFDRYVAENPTVRFQQGISGYSGTQDTWINEDSKNSSYGNSSRVWIDDDTDNHWWYDYEGQGLLRFDDIIGSGSGQIPVGATILRANLQLAVADDIDHPVYDPDFRVYHMTRNWNESSTWNSLNGGLSGSDYDALVGSFAGDDNPNDVNARNLDVTASVQRWANGEANYGFGIVSQIINGNDDGIELYSSEASEIMFRPALEVEYTLGSMAIAPNSMLFTTETSVLNLGVDASAIA